VPTWHGGTDIDVTVSVSHDVVLAACAYALTVDGTATAVVENRTVAAALARIGTDPDAPLDDNLPLILTPGATLSDVLVSLDTADPPGNSLDGLPPGSDVVVATYRLRLTGGGSLTLTLSAPRAAETQSDPEGSLFSVVTVDPVAFRRPVERGRRAGLGRQRCRGSARLRGDAGVFRPRTNRGVCSRRRGRGR
jgi:hypothetical protein